MFMTQEGRTRTIDNGKVHLTPAQPSMLLEGIDWKQPARTSQTLSML